MRDITIHQPRKLVIGQSALQQLVQDLRAISSLRLFILTDPHVLNQIQRQIEDLKAHCDQIFVSVCTGSEPTFTDLELILNQSRELEANYIVGIGGGSVLDIAKLVAALIYREEDTTRFIGNGLIGHREIPLICVPTTSGAGSEASPNAILIDENDNGKKGIIDRVLMPDSVYIDPNLMASLPPDVTAYTGLDALTHCIEAFANKNAHPVVDVYALEGIRLISQYLGRAIANGNDLEAREKVALGAYYGGMCLGPVNTAAVHALAYPLGTKYKIAHGLSNALLLPFVLEFNLEKAEDRYAEIALAMGGELKSSKREMALQGISLIRDLIRNCGMPARLSELNIGKEAVSEMASDAMLIQRLLVNNVREVNLQDAIHIYESAY